MVDGRRIELTPAEVAEREAEEKAWNDSKPSRDTIRQIEELENSVTPRRLREAICTNVGEVWLRQLDKEIESLRASL